MIKAARAIAYDELEELEGQSKFPSMDREYTYNPESFGRQDSWVEMIYSNLD